MTLFGDGDQMSARAVIRHGFGHCRRGHAYLSQVILSHQLERRTGLQHEHLALFTREQDLAVDCNRRSAEARCSLAQTLRIAHLACASIVDLQYAPVGTTVKESIEDK